MSSDLREVFPGLQTTVFQITSPVDGAHNCIAWAANETNRLWWPVGEGEQIHWPPDVAREETIDAFATAFLTLGYVAGADESLDPGFEKVALFVNAYDVPTHAARQLASGRWTSKLGKAEDIQHDLRALEGETYGSVTLILKRACRTDED